MQYEDIDKLPVEKLEEILGDAAKGIKKGKNPENYRQKLAARIKGAMRANEAHDDEPPMEDPEFVEVEVVEPALEEPKGSTESADSVVEVSAALLQSLQDEIKELRREQVELKSQVSSRTKMSRKSKQERAHARARVSDYFRDLIKEQRHYHNNGETKRFVVPRSFTVESEAFKNGRYAPCSQSGGMYYLKPRVDKVGPRTGDIMPPFVFNRHMYVDYTINGNKNELLRTDFVLCDCNGKEIKPFTESLPIEDLEKIRKQSKMREDARVKDTGIIEALKRLNV